MLYALNLHSDMCLFLNKIVKNILKINQFYCD